MTNAICFKCGHRKFGALTTCKECSFFPDDEREFVYSLLLSDHYFIAETLADIGIVIRGGETVDIAPEQEAAMLEQVREHNMVQHYRKVRARNARKGGG